MWSRLHHTKCPEGARSVFRTLPDIQLLTFTALAKCEDCPSLPEVVQAGSTFVPVFSPAPALAIVQHTKSPNFCEQRVNNARFHLLKPTPRQVSSDAGVVRGQLDGGEERTGNTRTSPVHMLGSRAHPITAPKAAR